MKFYEAQLDGSFKCTFCDRIGTRQSIISHAYVSHTERGKETHSKAGRKKNTFPAWNKGLTKSDARVLANSIQVSKVMTGKPGHSHTLETKEKISKSLSGNNHGGRCSWYLVDGVNVQGTWERDFALKMTQLHIKWEKVKKHAWKYVMHEKIRHYTPDFYLPEYDLFLEIKGFWWGNDKEKMKLVMEQHIDKKIVIIEKDKFEKFMRGELVW